MLRPVLFKFGNIFQFLFQFQFYISVNKNHTGWDLTCVQKPTEVRLV